MSNYRERIVIFTRHLLFSLLSLSLVTGAATAQSLDDLYQRAKKEGRVVLYAPLSSKTEDVVFPAFRKRFSGIIIDHVDATSDKLVARAITEVRGGRVFGDVFGGTPFYLQQMKEQNLLTDLAIPEAALYPAGMKGSYWVATDTEYFVAGWNTTRIKKGEEPKLFEDFADPRWKKRLAAEPRDFQLLMGLAKYKFNSDEKAVELFKKIAANELEFHRGHSELIELVGAGQADVCFSCYGHHFPPRIKQGMPLQIMFSEGVGHVGGTVTVLKDAPHPNAALLWARWLISEEGQKVYAQAGETPAHPKVEPLEKSRPTKVYMLAVDDGKEYPKYQKLWRDIFQIR